MIRNTQLIRTVLATLALLLSFGMAEAGVYKCVKDGVTTYQEVPCDGTGSALDIPLKTDRPVPEEQPHQATTQETEAAVPPAANKTLSQDEIDRIADAVEQRRLEAAAPPEEAGEDLEQEQPIASCRGIRIYSAVAYDVGGQTFMKRWRHDSKFRRQFVDIARTQCASIVVKLPGYYGDIFDSMEDTFARRFVATFADDTIRSGESIDLPHGRVNSAAKYRVRVCFGEGDIPISSIDCE